MTDTLPPRQQDALDALERYFSEHGVAPSTTDLGRLMGISSTTAHRHMLILKRKGYLDHESGKPRSWRLTRAQPARVPIVGRVAAGVPLLAAENVEGWVSVDRGRRSESLFALRVQGQSMVQAGILDGDLVIVRQQSTAGDGAFVVALVDDEDATVKELRRDGDQVHLIPHNDDYTPITAHAERITVLGQVVGVQRQLDEEDDA